MSKSRALLSMLLAFTPAALLAEGVPDFSGVYYPISPFGRAAGLGPQAGAQRQGPPPRPTASAPLSDGSRGRAPDAPSLTPEYMAKWQEISKSRIAGSYEYDYSAKCLPPGMPAMMSMAYGMEVMQTKDKITFFSELNDALRRVYLDGRKPSAKVLDDPTYAGYSTGHWEGDTLVVDVTNFNGRIWGPGQMKVTSTKYHVVERYTLEGDTLVYRVVIEDPDVLTGPFSPNPSRLTRPSETRIMEYECAENNINLQSIVQ